jgi:hypothetical protein
MPKFWVAFFVLFVGNIALSFVGPGTHGKSLLGIVFVAFFTSLLCALIMKPVMTLVEKLTVRIVKWIYKSKQN